MPRREWLSFLWTLKCSVRSLIRVVRIAIWTSGEPVSLALVALSLMSAVLRSADIDIGHPFRWGWVGPIWPLGRPQPGCRPAGSPIRDGASYTRGARACERKVARFGAAPAPGLRRGRCSL